MQLSVMLGRTEQTNRCSFWTTEGNQKSTGFMQECDNFGQRKIYVVYLFLICHLISKIIYLFFPQSYIFFGRSNSIGTGLPFNTSQVGCCLWQMMQNHCLWMKMQSCTGSFISKPCLSWCPQIQAPCSCAFIPPPLPKRQRQCWRLRAPWPLVKMNNQGGSSPPSALLPAS